MNRFGFDVCVGFVFFAAVACSGSESDGDTNAQSGGTNSSGGSTTAGSGGSNAQAGSATAGGGGTSAGGASAGTSSGGSTANGGSGGSGPPSGTGDEPNLIVQPWNGHAAAVSLTFDDADPSNLDAAGPELDERGLKGTFFIVCNTAAGSVAGFKALGDGGHEIANHTTDHTGASAGTADKVTGCHDYITTNFGKAPTTFAYPLVDTGPTYKNLVSTMYVASRGSGAALISATADPDWDALPSVFAGNGVGPNEINAATDAALAAGSWEVYTFHSIDTNSWYAWISRADYEAMLDHLMGKDIWVDTFAHVAGYLRGARLIAKATPTGAAGTKTWTWTVPAGFPTDVSLRVLIDGGTLSQGGQQVQWNSTDGYYPVDPKIPELTWTKQ